MGSVYNTMYHVTLGVWIGQTYQTIQSSNVISIAILHRYDQATYPIIRFRFYADMNLIEDMNDAPDQLKIACTIDGSIYKTSDDDQNMIVQPTSSMQFVAKAYLENKNIPVSRMDQYKAGIKDSDDLNVDSKVPFELFVYDDKIIHMMRQKAPSVYRNVSVETVVKDILYRVGIPRNKMMIDPIQNQKRYHQILIPNLTTIDAFTYFDRYYGLYPHGGLLYYDTISETMYLCDSSSQNQTQTIPIYIRSEKYDSDESGLFQYEGLYRMQTNAMNASILSETDIERALSSEIISDINVNTLVSDHTDMTRLFDVRNINDAKNKIEQKNILHKMDRTTLSLQEAARLNERITRVDLSGAGFDIFQFKPNTRINLVFESPIRGLKIADSYRAKYVCHVLTNSSGDLFASQTVMELCTN